MIDPSSVIERISNAVSNYENESRICLQLPKELVYLTAKIYQNLVKSFKGKRFYFLADSTFGIHDADVTAAQHINADVLIFVTTKEEKYIENTEPKVCYVNIRDIPSSTTTISPMRRYYLIEKVKNASIIGILVGSFTVSRYSEAIEYCSKLIKNSGRKSLIVYLGEPNVAKLANLPEVDIFVQICEPENIIQNQKEYYQPIASVRELAIALGDKELTEEEFDFRKLVPKMEKQDKSFTIVNSDSEEDILPGINSSGLEISVKNKHGELVSAGENRVSEYLENRVWKGVEIGEKREPALISMGRSGRAKDYNETI